jgi:hypothetical protein
MPQIFHRSTNTLSRISIFGAAFAVAGGLWGLAEFNRSSYVTQENVMREQPVQFSHKHHVGELGIDCRYCHGGCMNCHAQIWRDSPYLEPVRRSLATQTALQWIKVHDLPDFVYFNHQVHVAKGIGCVSCHGRVDEMNQLYQAESLQMEWCLDCHRHPERHVRPRDKVFDMAWTAPDQTALGAELVRAHDIHARTDCSTCHR